VVWGANEKLSFANFPIQKSLWFNQDYSSGVKLKSEPVLLRSELC
jgi:hypothetical protein